MPSFDLQMLFFKDFNVKRKKATCNMISTRFLNESKLYFYMSLNRSMYILYLSDRTDSVHANIRSRTTDGKSATTIPVVGERTLCWISTM